MPENTCRRCGDGTKPEHELCDRCERRLDDRQIVPRDDRRWRSRYRR